MDSTKQRELAKSLFDRNKKQETGTDNLRNLRVSEGVENLLR